MLRALASLLLPVVLAACGPTFYERYRDENPRWYVDFPDRGVDLEETLASLYAPPQGAYHFVISGLRIFRVDVDPWQEIDPDAVRSGRFRASPAHDYAVIAESWCQSRGDYDWHASERLSWYLLPENRLRFAEHHDYTEVCGVYRIYEPATGEYARVESLLRSQTSH